jgi:hypothetical protein
LIVPLRATKKPENIRFSGASISSQREPVPSDNLLAGKINSSNSM